MKIHLSDSCLYRQLSGQLLDQICDQARDQLQFQLLDRLNSLITSGILDNLWGPLVVSLKRGDV